MKIFEKVKNQIWDLANEVLKQQELQVYEINNLYEFDSDVIQILIEDKMQPNKPLDFDILDSVNEKISLVMDGIDLITEPYMLEIASAGIEKPIRNEQELVKAINQYINVKFKSPINKLNINQVDADLVSYDEKNEEFTIHFFIKGQKKKINIVWEQIDTVRYAVKF